MAIDLSRVAAAAIEAAFDDEKPRRRGISTTKAVAAGALLAAAARVAATKAPKPSVPSLSNLTSVPDALRDVLGRPAVRPVEHPGGRGQGHPGLPGHLGEGHCAHRPVLLPPHRIRWASRPRAGESGTGNVLTVTLSQP